jgi:hypothetical protein
MTIDEVIAREQIRRLIGKYAVCGDQLDIDGFAGTFAEDGTMEMTTYAHTGRAAIKHWMLNAEPFGAEDRRPTFVRHHMTSSHIDFDSPSTASGRTYFLVMTDIGVDHSGYYVDRLRKDGDEWLFAHRRVRILWRAPDSFIPEENLSKRRS